MVCSVLACFVELPDVADCLLMTLATDQALRSRILAFLLCRSIFSGLYHHAPSVIVFSGRGYVILCNACILRSLLGVGSPSFDRLTTRLANLLAMSESYAFFRRFDVGWFVRARAFLTLCIFAIKSLFTIV